jgi:hypothetical protein
LAGGSRWSRPRTLAVSSTTVGTLRRFNYYDEHCSWTLAIFELKG